LKPSEKAIKRKTSERIPSQGEIYYVDLPRQNIRLNGRTELGREMCGPHRCLVLQSADTVREMAYAIVMPISSVREKPERESWVLITEEEVSGIPKSSYLVCEQIRCVDRRRIGRYVGALKPMSAIFVTAQKILDFLCPPVLKRTR
jgi:mRNA-degrading endonuclease toxin of MazEF toxin-antitoxin module